MFIRKPLFLVLFPLLMPVLAASAQTSPTDQQLNLASSRTSTVAKENPAVESAQTKPTENQSNPVAAVRTTVDSQQSQSDSTETSPVETQQGSVASYQAAPSVSQQISVAAIKPVAMVQSVAAPKPVSTAAISQGTSTVQSQFTVQSAPVTATAAPTENQQFTTANSTCSNISLGVNGSLNGFVPSPNDSWHVDVSAAPVASLSATIISEPYDLGNYHLHPDFGSIYGIPYNVVDSGISSTQSQVLMPMTLYPGDSDLTYYPVQTGMAIEDDPGDCSQDNDDRHMLVVDRHSCVDYEVWQAEPCKGSWSASNGLLFDLLTTEQRPYGVTSADASGLSVFEGLVRYDEILAGSINHAIRFTVPLTKADANGGYFVAPATHAAGTNWGTDNVMGMRIRLKASFDVSSFSPTNQIILNAMKKYGMILVDNGSAIYFQGTQDSRWDDNDLSALSYVYSSNFDVVSLPTSYDENTAPTGAAPVITNFTATPTTSAGKTYYILKANISGATYSYMDSPGINNGVIFRGFMAVEPTKTTTYTLTSRNLYGTTQSQITVTIK